MKNTHAHIHNYIYIYNIDIDPRQLRLRGAQERDNISRYVYLIIQLGAPLAKATLEIPLPSAITTI